MNVPNFIRTDRQLALQITKRRFSVSDLAREAIGLVVVGGFLKLVLIVAAVLTGHGS